MVLAGSILDIESAVNISMRIQNLQFATPKRAGVGIRGGIGDVVLA